MSYDLITLLEKIRKVEKLAHLKTTEPIDYILDLTEVQLNLLIIVQVKSSTEYECRLFNFSTNHQWVQDVYGNPFVPLLFNLDTNHQVYLHSAISLFIQSTLR